MREAYFWKIWQPSLQARFNQLLEHRCPICDDHDQKFEDQGGGGEKQQSGEEGGGRKKPAASGRNKFSTFRQLDKHVRQEHDLYYCDLCTGHLKVIGFWFSVFYNSEIEFITAVPNLGYVSL